MSTDPTAQQGAPIESLNHDAGQKTYKLKWTNWLSTGTILLSKKYNLLQRDPNHTLSQPPAPMRPWCSNHHQKVQNIDSTTMNKNYQNFTYQFPLSACTCWSLRARISCTRRHIRTRKTNPVLISVFRCWGSQSGVSWSTVSWWRRRWELVSESAWRTCTFPCLLTLWLSNPRHLSN